MDVKFTKLSALVGEEILIKTVSGYKFKKWDDATKKMLVSDNYKEGYRKLYQVETDKGLMDLGSGQLGSLLEAVFDKGKADLIGRTFYIKSNGKQGLDIRYYFNPVEPANQEESW